MKNTFVPLDKQSKKAQRAAVRANRALWQGVKLCPRIMRKKTLKKVVQHPHFSV